MNAHTHTHTHTHTNTCAHTNTHMCTHTHTHTQTHTHTWAHTLFFLHRWNHDHMNKSVVSKCNSSYLKFFLLDQIRHSQHLNIFTSNVVYSAQLCPIALVLTNMHPLSHQHTSKQNVTEGPRHKVRLPFCCWLQTQCCREPCIYRTEAAPATDRTAMTLCYKTDIMNRSWNMSTDHAYTGQRQPQL